MCQFALPHLVPRLAMISLILRDCVSVPIKMTSAFRIGRSGWLYQLWRDTRLAQSLVFLMKLILSKPQLPAKGLHFQVLFLLRMTSTKDCYAYRSAQPWMGVISIYSRLWVLVNIPPS
ncbi:hypothetical protein AYO08_14355 [Pseudomonas putida]|nr:hypothetical protein AYO08_14355 [Pseudomonas putida]